MLHPDSTSVNLDECGNKRCRCLDLAEGCCAPLTDASLEPDQADKLARMFKALGDPVRLRLLSMITSAPDGEICVCELTPSFDWPGRRSPTT